MLQSLKARRGMGSRMMVTIWVWRGSAEMVRKMPSTASGSPSSTCRKLPSMCSSMPVTASEAFFFRASASSAARSSGVKAWVAALL